MEMEQPFHERMLEEEQRHAETTPAKRELLLAMKKEFHDNLYQRMSRFFGEMPRGS